MITLTRKLISTQDAINIARENCQARGLMLGIGGKMVPDGAVRIECNIGDLLVILCHSGARGTGARSVCFSSRFEINGEKIRRADLEKIIQAA